jgi:hypothetical protein
VNTTAGAELVVGAGAAAVELEAPAAAEEEGAAVEEVAGSVEEASGVEAARRGREGLVWCVDGWRRRGKEKEEVRE